MNRQSENNPPSFLKRLTRRASAFLRKLVSFKSELEDTLEPQLIKAMIPRSWFTKKGPGVTHDAREAFLRMTPAQQDIAIERGWLPAHWVWGKGGATPR